MSRFVFEATTPGDDAALRRCMAEERMEGHVAVSFRREPSYFAGCAVQGESWQVLKCVDRARDTLAGLGARLSLEAFVNGEPRRIGYLADLRARRPYRGGTLLARAYAHLRALHESDPLPLHYSLILDGNATAVAALTGARAGLPVYTDRGRVLTPALHLDLAHRAPPARGLGIAPARPEQIPAVFDFVAREYRRYQLAPRYRAGQLGTARLRGLQAGDIHVATRGNTIVGTLAAWDQRAFRQTHIERYSPGLRALRPLYNALARVSPLKPLPARGAPLPYRYLALAAVEDDDPDVFRALLHRVHETYRRGPWHYLVAGLHEAHRLAPLLAEYRRIEAGGRLYTVRWPGDDAPVLDGRVPHIEIAAA